jgi:hypothetical protein
VTRTENRKGAYGVLVGRPTWKYRRRWEDNIKIDINEVECRGMDWIDVALDSDRWRAVVNVVMNLRVP